MLGHEHTLTVCDLADVVPDVYKTIVMLQKVCFAKSKIENDATLMEEQKTEQVSKQRLFCCTRCNSTIKDTNRGFLFLDK